MKNRTIFLKTIWYLFLVSWYVKEGAVVLVRCNIRDILNSKRGSYNGNLYSLKWSGFWQFRILIRSIYRLFGQLPNLAICIPSFASSLWQIAHEEVCTYLTGRINFHYNSIDVVPAGECDHVIIKLSGVEFFGSTSQHFNNWIIQVVKIHLNLCF